MGCYWNCECVFETADENIHEKVMDFIHEKYPYRNLEYSSDERGIAFSYWDDSHYGFGVEFEDMMCDAAEKFCLDGYMYIDNDERDADDVPQKTTFEHGKPVYWVGKIVYERMED